VVRKASAPPVQSLATISRATLDQIADEKLARGCSNATVNRTLALVRAILRKCVNEWEWLERCPQVRMLRRWKASAAEPGGCRTENCRVLAFRRRGPVLSINLNKLRKYHELKA
jgi:hypothetical protein